MTTNSTIDATPFKFLRVKHDGTDKFVSKLTHPYEVITKATNSSCAAIRPLYGKSVKDAGESYCMNTNEKSVRVLTAAPETNYTTDREHIFYL